MFFSCFQGQKTKKALFTDSIFWKVLTQRSSNAGLVIQTGTVTKFVSERGFLEVTGLPYDAYQAEISTSSETMKCSIFDYPMEVYGVTGGFVKDSIITCGGRGFKTFYGKLKITLLCAVHVISIGRQMTNLALNFCFDFFSNIRNIRSESIRNH